MKWYWLVVITILAYQSIVLVIYVLTKENEDITVRIALCIPYLVLWVVCYPVRARNRYKNNSKYFERHNITWPQYLFGKRVKEVKPK